MPPLSAAHTTGPPPGTPVPRAIPSSSVQVKSLPAEMSHLAGIPSTAHTSPEPAQPAVDDAAAPAAPPSLSQPDDQKAPASLVRDHVDADELGQGHEDNVGEEVLGGEGLEELEGDDDLGDEVDEVEAAAAVEDEGDGEAGGEGEDEDEDEDEDEGDEESAAPFLELTFGHEKFALVGTRSPAPRFLPDDEGQETVPVRKVNRAHLLEQPLDALFQLLRTPEFFGDFLQDDTELLLDFPELDLQLTEDNVFAREVTLKDMQTFHIGLCLGGALQIAVSEGTRFINRFNRLSAQVSGTLDLDEGQENENGAAAEVDADLGDDEDLGEAHLVQEDQGDAVAEAEAEEGAEEGALNGDDHAGNVPSDEHDVEEGALDGNDPAVPGDQQEHVPSAEEDELEAGSIATQQEQIEQAANEQAIKEDYVGFDPDDHARLAMPDPINKQQKRAACAALDGEVVDNPADAPASPKKARVV